MEIIKSITDSLNNFGFAENYRTKAYVKNFNDHMDALMETCLAIEDLPETRKPTFNFTNTVYWECEAMILEQLDDVTDTAVLNALDNLEDMLYSKLIEHLGRYYRNGNSQWINRMLDMTVTNTILSAKFEYFSKEKFFQNPWADATNILFENKLIYTFSDNVSELKDIGLKINNKESELVVDKLIGVAGKGSKNEFATGYFRDVTALRNLVHNLLESRNHNSSNPLKREKIIKEIRIIGIKDSELTDNNIQNWLINPLKRTNRIGSNKDGYFVINSAEDLQNSYSSHYENFKGYYRTLERHKKLANQFELSEELLDKHNNFLKNQQAGNEDMTSKI